MKLQGNINLKSILYLFIKYLQYPDKVETNKLRKKGYNDQRKTFKRRGATSLSLPSSVTEVRTSRDKDLMLVGT